ncbi:hypothetical protein [Bradyrhizobium icense]|nr:hypothetical protein [Bradyrhizobium icense]
MKDLDVRIQHLEKEVEKNLNVETVWLRIGTPTPLAARCSW